MSRKFLFVVSSHDQLGTTGKKAGSWLEELASAYWRFVDAGYRVTIASPKGGAAPIDPMSVEESWISGAGRRFRNDDAATAAMADTVSLSDVDGREYEGLYLVGGSATTWDFPHNPSLKTLVEEYFAQNKVIGAVCHGVLGLIQAVSGHGEPLIKNRNVTGISNAEEKMMGLDRIVPVLPEEMLRKLRGVYSAAAPLAEHVVIDPPFFTGQNPASADPLAVAMIAHLERARQPTAEMA